MFRNFEIRNLSIILESRQTKIMLTQFNELTDFQWGIISPMFNIQRKRKNSLRKVVNAIFLCSERSANGEICHSRVILNGIYCYFYKWTNNYTIRSVNFLLNSCIREYAGREATPSLGCIDSQSIKIVPMIFEDKGVWT